MPTFERNVAVAEGSAEGWKRKHALWMTENPLEEWRRRNGLRSQDLPIILDMSASVLRAWLTGLHQAREAQLKIVAEKIGMPDLLERYNAWYARRPHYKVAS